MDLISIEAVNEAAERQCEENLNSVQLASVAGKVMQKIEGNFHECFC